MRKLLGITLAGQVVGFYLSGLFPTSGLLGSWHLEPLGISGLEGSSASNPPLSPEEFFNSYVAKPPLSLFFASDNGLSIAPGDTVPEYMIDPSDPI